MPFRPEAFNVFGLTVLAGIAYNASLFST